MRNKIREGGLLLGIVLMTSIFASAFVFGYDASNPYSVTLNWIVPEDTTFTVALAGAETTIDFNPTNKSSKEVMADSQTDSVPIITVTNQGNVIANYTAQVTANLPTWVVLKGKSSYDYSTANTVNNGKQNIFLEENSWEVSAKRYLEIL